MNDADKKLQEFFYDTTESKGFKASSRSLSAFHDECYSIINNKLYTDINIKDEKGNTYLHYLSNRCSWAWFLNLVHLGADPTILNNEGLNAFDACSSPAALANFWRLNTVKDLDSFINRHWADKTEKFAPKFKQFLFNRYLSENKHVFKSISRAIEFLEKAQLDTDLNRIKIIATSREIGIEEKVDWYETRYSDREQNSEFLARLLNSPPLLGDKYYYYQQVMKLLEKDFVQTKFLDRVAVDLIVENKKDMTSPVCRSLIKMMLRCNFDLNTVAGYDKKTILEQIQNNPFTHKIYLDENLVVKQSSKKAMKV